MHSRIVICIATAAALFGGVCDAYTTKWAKDGGGLLMSGAQGPPDLERGKQAAAAGRVEDAEQDLKGLAERGYLDAKIALGRLYAGMDDPARRQLAIRWFREAVKDAPERAQVPLGRILAREGTSASLTEAEGLLNDAYQKRKDPEALGGLIRLYAEYPERDTKERIESLAAKAEKITHPETQTALVYWYRRTPDIEGHPDKLLDLCDRALDVVTDCYVILARDARTRGDKEQLQKLVVRALGQYTRGLVPAPTAASLARTMVEEPDDASWGRPPAPSFVSDLPEAEEAGAIAGVSASPPAVSTRSCGIEPIAAAKEVEQQAPTPQAGAETELANQLLEKLARGPDDARVQAAGVVVRYPYLAPNIDLEKSLQSGSQRRVAQAPLFLGELYLQGQRATRDPHQAQRYLERAAETAATEIQGHYMLGRLYQLGYLDEVDAERAGQHLLWAARRGYQPADAALARLFANSKGVCPDLVNAYVFAKLAARTETPRGAELRRQIEAALSPKQRADAEKLYAQELAIRPKFIEGELTVQTASSRKSAHTDNGPDNETNNGEQP
jgi:alginate biosynthesis protein AlgK